MDKKTKLAIMMNNIGKQKEPWNININLELCNFDESWINLKNTYNFLTHNLKLFDYELKDGEFELFKTNENLEEEDKSGINNENIPNSISNFIKFYKKEIESNDENENKEILNKFNNIKVDEEINNYNINFDIILNEKQISMFENYTYKEEPWIHCLEFTRYPDIDEDELIKIKKKLKGDQLNLLNPVKFECKWDLSKLKIPGVKNLKDIIVFKLISGDGDLGLNFKSQIEINFNRPINPYIKNIFPKISEISNLNKIKSNNITNVSTAKKLLEQKILLIFKILSKEYSLINNNLNESKNDKKNNFLSQQDKNKILNERKENFVKKFLKSKKYDLIKDELVDLIHELVYDKIIKEVGLSNNNQKILKIVNEIYVYLKKLWINKMILYFNKNNVNKDPNDENEVSLVEDISKSIKNFMNNKNQIDYSKESNINKKLNLIKEYEILGNNYIVNKKFKDYLIVDKNNLELWIKYSIFNLKNHNYVMGELCLLESLKILQEVQPKDEERYNSIKTYYLCLLLRRKRFWEFEKGMQEILNYDKKLIIQNLLMSFYYSEYRNNIKKGKKYFNVSYKIYKKKNVSSDNDEIIEDLWLELVSFLFKNTIIFLCEKLIDKIKKRIILKKHIITNILISKKKYNESNLILNEILELESNNISAIKTKAANNYFLGKLFEAEELFLKYFKNNSDKNDFDVLLILGNIYLRRKSFFDAKIIFKKSCSLKPNSYNSWLGLGISCWKLKDFEESEEALLNANLYDPLNSEVFGYITILFLQLNRIKEAKNVFENMLNYEISNLFLLIDLAKEFIDHKLFDKAIFCYKKVINEDNQEILDLLINQGLDKYKLLYELGLVNYQIEDYDSCKQYFNQCLSYEKGYFNDKINDILLEIV